MRDGHLFFHGRVDDQIKVSGVNVSPSEVERVLLAVVGVAQAFVVGVPDTQRGAIVAAAIITDSDAVVDPGDVVKQVGERLSSYKVPRIVAIIEATDIPMKSSGKVDRFALAEMLTSHPRLR
jgi:acyl-coenzyme A synthetase/AMP-(fatty) acid ligase